MGPPTIASEVAATNLTINPIHRLDESEFWDVLACNTDCMKKSGYLIESISKYTGIQYKRYFILNNISLKCYIDQIKTNFCTLNIWLSGDAIVSEVEKQINRGLFSLVISCGTGLNQTVLYSKKESELMAWKEAIEGVIVSNLTMEGYAVVKADENGASSTTKYFVLMGITLTYHQDHTHRNDIEGMLIINKQATVNILTTPITCIEIIDRQRSKR